MYCVFWYSRWKYKVEQSKSDILKEGNTVLVAIPITGTGPENILKVVYVLLILNVHLLAILYQFIFIMLNMVLNRFLIESEFDILI